MSDITDAIQRLRAHLATNGGIDLTWKDKHLILAGIDNYEKTLAVIASVPEPASVGGVDDWPTDGTCRQCGHCPRSPVTGLCATCQDEARCTTCDDTGITIQTERACSCEAGDQYRAQPQPQPAEVREITWEVWEDDLLVASSSSEADARHYLAVYSQDAAVRLIKAETVRTAIAPAALDREGRG